MPCFCCQGNASGLKECCEQMLKAENIQYLVVHCSDTADDDSIGVRDIHSMHLGFGWDGIGYHRVIERDGKICMGRPDYWVGAHVRGFNEHSLGVCLLGRHKFTAAQLGALATVLRAWRDQYPHARICGHCDFDYTEKTCPNFDVKSWCAKVGLTP